MFIILATFVCQENDWLAAVVLKNTLQNHVIEMKDPSMVAELEIVKQMLAQKLAD